LKKAPTTTNFQSTRTKHRISSPKAHQYKTETTSETNVLPDTFCMTVSEVMDSHTVQQWYIKKDSRWIRAWQHCLELITFFSLHYRGEQSLVHRFGTKQQSSIRKAQHVGALVKIRNVQRKSHDPKRYNTVK